MDSHCSTRLILIIHIAAALSVEAVQSGEVIRCSINGSIGWAGARGLRP